MMFTNIRLFTSNQRCFNPALPNEVVASFYVQGYKLTLATYHLCTNQNGRVDIANKHQVLVMMNCCCFLYGF